MEGYQSSFDESDDNLNFNDDYDDDAQNFFTMFILSFCFFIMIFRCMKRMSI